MDRRVRRSSLRRTGAFLRLRGTRVLLASLAILLAAPVVSSQHASADDGTGAVTAGEEAARLLQAHFGGFLPQGVTGTGAESTVAPPGHVEGDTMPTTLPTRSDGRITMGIGSQSLQIDL